MVYMQFKRFGSQARFEQIIFEGFSLFCGAGFSVMAKDNEGNYLPTGPQLLDEIKIHFNSLTGNLNKLETSATKLNRSLDKQRFKDFLTRRLTVGDEPDCYDKYNALLALNIANIFTTNIDNLWDRIYSQENTLNSDEKRINNALKKGVSRDPGMVNLYPLHGHVLTPQEDYMLSKRELATAYSQTGLQHGWNEFQNIIADKPILFWGWNFADYDVIHAMYAEDFHKNEDKWAILFTDDKNMPSDDDIEQLESDNFNIIYSNTDDFLAYLHALIATRDIPVVTTETDYNPLLDVYLPPKKDSLPVMPFEKFFTDYYPDWYHIYHDNIVKTHWFRDVRNTIAEGKDLLLSGIPGCGKTTLLRQLAVEYNATSSGLSNVTGRIPPATFNFPVHYMEKPSVDEAKRYIALLNGRRSLLFVDDALRDTYAFIEFVKARNIHVIATTRDYNFDRQSFRLLDLAYEFKDITLLTEEDVVNIAESVPRSLKNNNWQKATTRVTNRNIDLTMVSIFPQVTGGIHNFRFIHNFYKQDPDAARVFCMVCYASACGTIVSFDMVYSFLGDTQHNYRDMYDIIKRSGQLIIGGNASPQLITRHGEMDYYDCRSPYLAKKILDSTVSNQEIFADVLWDFTERVNISKICRYDLFRQNGYDSELALKAFCKKQSGEYKEIETGRGERYYEMCRRNDDSEYIYQHAAVYFKNLKQYDMAYDWINRAKNVSRFDRYSILNTEAQIRFDANFDKDKTSALLIESLDNMNKYCAEDKKRAHIHIHRFVEYALRFYDKAADMGWDQDAAIGYIKNAYAYISNILTENKEGKTRIGHRATQQFRTTHKKIEKILNNHDAL